MENILDFLETGIICLDDRLLIVSINTAAEMLFAVSGRQLRGVDIARAVPELETCRHRMTRVAYDNAALTMREMVLATADGVTRHVDLTISPRLDDRGPTRLILEFQALDRQRRISQGDEMRSQHQANREMIRGLAHEIKNPLGGLSGAAQLLERELIDPALRQYTAVIKREAERLQDLVEGLLGPRQPPDKQRLNIHEPLEHVAALTAADHRHQIELNRDYDPSLPDIFADHDQLVQVFLNLVDNAVAALKPCGGRITLRTRVERLVTIDKVQYRNALRVEVIDDGPGIEEARIKHIFHPMVSSHPEGGGMGLPLAQYLVQLHNGIIHCESQPGHTEFSVILPLDTERANA